MPEIEPEVLERLDRLERDAQIAKHPGVDPATGCPLPPIVLNPDSMNGRLASAYQARQEQLRQEQQAAHAAEERRLRLEREAEEERKRAEWEANRPKREAAQRELELVEAELGALDQQLGPLRRRARALKVIAGR